MDLELIIPQILKSPDIIRQLPPAIKRELISLMEGMIHDETGWPRAFVNRDTLKTYTPHTLQEAAFVYSDTPRYGLLRGGEGSGKSTAGIIKNLHRTRRSMVGLMCSPDLPHFQRSLWKEYQRWCPWDMVIPAHRRMADLAWVPSKPFDIVFENGTYVHGVGVKNAGSLEGPNLSWVHFDEARHYPDKSAVVVPDGRCRIPGPHGEPPQLWYTTTPRMNWLFEFFGPVQCKCLDCDMSFRGEDGIEIQIGNPLVCAACGSDHIDVLDDRYSFKADSTVVRLTTKMNEVNVMANFAAKRGQTLTSAEGLVLLEGLWGEIEDGQPFLPTILWWDQCREDLPVLKQDEPLIIAMDAATGRETAISDCFAIVGITRHPDYRKGEDTCAVRFTRTWQAKVGGKIDFQGTRENPGPERFLLNLCGFDLDDQGGIYELPQVGYRVLEVVFDPTELHDMSTRLSRQNVTAFRPFGQNAMRSASDRQLLNLIQRRKIVHDGDSELRLHMSNADRKLNTNGALRIVKRSESTRIDLAVAVSMGAFEILRLNL